MRRILVLLAILGASVAVPATLLATTAQATTAVTIHADNVPIDIGPVGCIPGDLVITGNAVQHTTTNNAGDVWLTETVTGQVVDTTAGFVGHGMAWFGLEENAQNSVTHFTANVEGTLPDGTSLRIHQEGQFTLNAQGVPVVTRVTTTCG